MATPQSRRGIPRAKAKELPVPKVATASTPASPATASAAGKPGEDRFIVEGPGTKVPAPPPQPGTKPAATAGSYFVQVGAFSTESRAAAAAKLDRKSVG